MTKGCRQKTNTYTQTIQNCTTIISHWDYKEHYAPFDLYTVTSVGFGGKEKEEKLFNWVEVDFM